MRGAGMELGASSAVDLIREFAAELKRIFAHRQADKLLWMLEAHLA